MSSKATSSTKHNKTSPKPWGQSICPTQTLHESVQCLILQRETHSFIPQHKFGPFRSPTKEDTATSSKKGPPPKGEVDHFPSKPDPNIYPNQCKGSRTEPFRTDFGVEQVAHLSLGMTRTRTASFELPEPTLLEFR